MDQATLKRELSYNPETGEFVRLVTRSQSKQGAIAGYTNKKSGYVLIEVCGKTWTAHRLAWLYVHGEWPQRCIDHINKCRSDNRISNLRDVTMSENIRNSKLRTDNSSGVTGVYSHKQSGGWMAMAWKEGKQVFLGWFKAKGEAIDARKLWEAQNPLST